ncbi:hypothetical protein C9927_04740, partial [Pseudidiomarina aestuarii]
VKGGQSLAESSYGLADRSFNIDNAIDYRFSINSISKTFTAAAVMQLVESGEISLDQSVGAYLPELNAAWMCRILRIDGRLPERELFKVSQPIFFRINIGSNWSIIGSTSQELINKCAPQGQLVTVTSAIDHPAVRSATSIILTNMKTSLGAYRLLGYR